MARITTYALDSNISLNDKLIGTDADDNSITKNYSIGALGDGLISLKNIITGGGTLNTIPLFTPDGQKIDDSIITQAATGQGVTVTGRLDVTSDFSVAGVAELYDSLTVDGTLTVDDSTVLNGDLTVYNSAFMNSALTVEGVSTFNDDIEVNNNATFYSSTTFEDTAIFQQGIGDNTASTGTAGQVLSSTGDAVQWIDISSGTVSGTGTTNTLPIWADGPNGELGDSQITQTKVDGGTVFDLNAITTTAYTPAINTKLLDLNSGGIQKFSITQDGGGGVLLPSGDILNVGPSFNMGGNAYSNGENALSVGAATTAFGNGSFAANFITLASGGGSSAFGLLTEAGGLASAVFGNKSVASGPYSIASGQDSIASGQSSVAIGEKGDAQGKNTFVSGFGGTAIGNNAVKFGYEGTASGSNSAKFGFESVAGGANSLATGTNTTASGLQSVATGDDNVVSGNNSFIGGKNSTVTGSESIAYGISNTISANTCAVFGVTNGVPAGGFQSFVVGNNNNAGTQGQQKLIGTYLEGSSQFGVYLGTYNDNTDSFNKFQIGNGNSGARSNALSINYQGRVKLPAYGLGSVTGTATYNLGVNVNGIIVETEKPYKPDYLSFVCLLSQSDGSPQPDLVLENSLGVVSPYSAFTRIASGEYNLSAPGKFKLLKTIVFVNGGSAENNHDVAWEVIDADNLRIRTHNSDGKLTKASLEIRTYN